MSASSLLARLLGETKRFSLGQAIRLLGRFYGKTLEDGGDFIDQNIKIRPWLSLGFPATELEACERDSEKNQFLLTATSFGLYSTMGALPTFYTEELLEEFRSDESVSRDFLDILNNHFYHLLYAAEHHNSLERRTIEGRRRDCAQIQFCLMGQGEQFSSESLYPEVTLSEFFVRRSRSIESVESYIARALHRGDVEVEQCCERHVRIEESQRCYLGKSNNVLGEDAVLGQEIVDVLGKFRIHLHKVNLEDIEHFLPGRKQYLLLEKSLRQYLTSSLEFDLVLHPVSSDTAPRNQLGANLALGFFLGRRTQYEPVHIYWKQAPILLDTGISGY